jgi:hypothetical protein
MTAQVLVNGSPDVFGDRQTGSGRQSFKRLDNSLWQKNMCAFHTHMIAFLRRQNIGEKRMKAVICILVLLSLSGCLTLNEGMLRKVDSIQVPQKSALVETKIGEFVQKLNGEGANRGVLANTTVGNSVVKMIMNRWERKGIVDDYGAPGDLKGKPDYTLVLSGSRNEDTSIAGAVFSGLTLMLLPSTTTLTFDLNAELIDNRTGQKYHATAKNGVTSVMQILLLPALPFSWIGTKNAFDDIADHLYSEFHEQGAFGGKPNIGLR